MKHVPFSEAKMAEVIRSARYTVLFLSIFALGSCLTTYFDTLLVAVSYHLVKSINTFSSYRILKAECTHCLPSTLLESHLVD